MQGITLIVTFLVIATISLVVAGAVGIVLDNFPHVHDLLAVLGFFGTLIVLLPASWVLAVRMTELKQPTAA